MSRLPKSRRRQLRDAGNIKKKSDFFKTNRVQLNENQGVHRIGGLRMVAFL